MKRTPYISLLPRKINFSQTGLLHERCESKQETVYQIVDSWNNTRDAKDSGTLVKEESGEYSCYQHNALADRGSNQESAMSVTVFIIFPQVSLL
jgi:hypothetical protein